MNKIKKNQIVIPLLPLRDLVVFPGMITPLFVGRSKSITALEQKRATSSFTEQRKALEGLNVTAYLLLQAMEEMGSGGSASGFEQYLAQLEQMSGQQMGINQGTMQLPLLGMAMQQQLMAALQAQQQALQEALKEMLGDMPGNKPGGLSKAEKDMEEVIADFKRRKVNRETMERQEQILSRMLDSQKSMTQKDYSEKRKSHIGKAFDYLLVFGNMDVDIHNEGSKLIKMGIPSNDVLKEYSKSEDYILCVTNFLANHWEKLDTCPLQVDENYIRESILYPQMNIVKGFPNGNMPTFKGLIRDREIQGIIEYIKELK